MKQNLTVVRNVWKLTAHFKSGSATSTRIEYTLTWLDCETRMVGGKKVVNKLRCKICTKFQSSIQSGKNFNDKWMIGAESVCASNVRDHAYNYQYTHVMKLLTKERSTAEGLGPSAYAPIARALNRLPDDERRRLRFKFDIAHFVAVEKLSFLKYPRICQLQEHHGVDLGTSYINEAAGKSFVHYIAQSRREDLVDRLKKANFFSLLLDASTDKDNIDNELVLAVCCDIDGNVERIHTRMSYFTVSRPKQSLLMVFSMFWKVPYSNLEYRPSLKATAKRWLGLPQMGHLLVLLQWD